MKYVCQLPLAVQAEIKADAMEILQYIGMSENEIQSRINDIMNEKLINIVGSECDYLGHPLELDFNKYKYYL